MDFDSFLSPSYIAYMEAEAAAQDEERFIAWADTNELEHSDENREAYTDFLEGQLNED